MSTTGWGRVGYGIGYYGEGVFETVDPTGVNVTGAVGTLATGTGTFAALSAVFATGEIGSFVFSEAVYPTNVSAAGSVGSVVPAQGASATLTGLAATFSQGTLLVWSETPAPPDGDWAPVGGAPSGGWTPITPPGTGWTPVMT